MKLDLETIKLVNLFEKITRVHPKDCFEYNNKVVFLVPENKLYYAIGKNGRNAEKLNKMLKKRVKIVSFGDDATKFVKSFIAPIKADDITYEDNIVTIIINNVSEKAILIGRNSRNLKSLKELIKKYYKDVENLVIQ